MSSNYLHPEPSLVSIPCTMCTKQEPSVCSCKTCIHYLCERCYTAHDSMVCFQNHEIVPIEDNESCIKPYLDFEQKPASSPSDSEDDNKTKAQIIAALYDKGQKRLEAMLSLVSELQAKLDDLHKDRAAFVGQMDDMHRKYQESLKHQHELLVDNYTEHVAERQALLAGCKASICDSVNKLVTQLATFKYMLEKGSLNGEAAPGDGDAAYEGKLILAALQLLKLHENRIEGKASPLSSGSDGSLEARRANALETYKTFGQKGNGIGMLNSPHGFCLGHDDDVIVCDTGNHRVQIYNKYGLLRNQFGISGRHDGHMWHPRKVALLPNKRQFVVCDRGYERSRMQIFTEDGKFLRKIQIQYIDIVSGIAITDKEHIVLVDSVTPTVFIIGDNDFMRSYDCSHFMEEPSDVAIAGKNYFICDFKAHCVCVINEDGMLLYKIGNRQITTFPNGIEITRFGHVLIGDSHGNYFHISVYTKDGDYVTDLRCPFIKVSRCCGLKLTEEGNVVTVDKNYHHVIILENIYSYINM